MTRPGEIDATGEAYRPLVSRAGLFGLGSAVVVVLAMLLPSALRRQALALEILPDALSLIYLDLNLARRPLDAELRLQVARKTLEAGQFAAARATVEPLLVPGSPQFERAAALKLTARAEELRLEIDRKAWAAIPPAKLEARATALARVLADLDALDLSRAPVERVQQIAELCQSLAQPERAAVVLDALARRQLPEFEAHVAAAETAHLQADSAARAIELQRFAAQQTTGDQRRAHALRALELARGVMSPEAQLELAEDARRRFGSSDPRLMAASLDLAQAVDIKLAYQLAQKLVQVQPDDPVLHRRLAKLAEWNGLSLRALDEYVWLVKRENRAADRARAIELAKSNWDLPLLRKLLAGPRAMETAPEADASKPATKRTPTARARRPAPARAERTRRRAEWDPQASRLPSRAASPEATVAAEPHAPTTAHPKLSLRVKCTCPCTPESRSGGDVDRAVERTRRSSSRVIGANPNELAASPRADWTAIDRRSTPSPAAIPETLLERASPSRAQRSAIRLTSTAGDSADRPHAEAVRGVAMCATQNTHRHESLSAHSSYPLAAEHFRRSSHSRARCGERTGRRTRLRSKDAIGALSRGAEREDAASSDESRRGHTAISRAADAQGSASELGPAEASVPASAAAEMAVGEGARTQSVVAAAKGGPNEATLAESDATASSEAQNDRTELLPAQTASTSTASTSTASTSTASDSNASRSAPAQAQRELTASSANSVRRVGRLRSQLRETLSLLEALGDTRAAISAVDAALRGPLGFDAATWETKVALLQRAGDAARAADTWSELAARFPSRARSIALADMRLALAQPRAALTALMSAPGTKDETLLRQILDVAWELGDLPACETAARDLVALPSASAWDVARLYQLQRANPDPRVALATAAAGFDRFKNAEMLRLVIEAASHANDDAQVAKLLRDAERFGGFRSDPGYWQQRITLHQRLAFAAFEQREFVAAKRELGEAEKALASAPELAPTGNDIYDLLRTSQNAQALAIALESGDKPGLAEVFAKYGSELPVRQQVYVLHRLGRDDEAYALARKGASDPRLSDDDRAALRADQPPSSAASTIDRTDYARASSEFFDSEGLRLWTSQADVEVDGESFGVRGAATLSEITPQQSLRSLQPSAAREVQGELGGRILASELSVGLRVHEGDSARPFGAFKQGILGERGSLLSVSASFNTLTFDSAQLRLAGATDEATLQSSIPLGLGYYVSARAAGNRYLTLERDSLGAGVSVDSGIGRSFTLPGDFARAAVRVAGRFAPRFRDADREAKQDPRQPELWIPHSTSFTGVGASLARGELELPGARDPDLRFLIDGAIGVLWPTQKLGWSGQVGVGSRLFGNDQLSAALQTGNVVGSVAYWSLQAAYAVGLE
jgi:Tetratricopeptide repeat